MESDKGNTVKKKINNDGSHHRLEKMNIVSLFLMFIVAVATATICASTCILHGGTTADTSTTSAVTLGLGKDDNTNDNKDMDTSFDGVAATVVEAEIDASLLPTSLRRRVSADNTDEGIFLTISDGCGESIPKSTVVTVYEKLLNGDSTVHLKWEDCDFDTDNNDEVKVALSLRLPATKKANGQFYTFSSTGGDVADDDGATIALACDDIETNICDLGIQVVSEEAPVLPVCLFFFVCVTRRCFEMIST